MKNPVHKDEFNHWWFRTGADKGGPFPTAEDAWTALRAYLQVKLGLAVNSPVTLNSPE